MHNIFTDILYSVIPNKTYLTFGEGTTNLILSAPHGGDIRPISIPKRKSGTLLKDTYTRRLTEKLLNLFKSENPFYIYADIHRSRVDLNRYVEKAINGNYRANEIWLNWDELLRDYTKKAKLYNDKVLYIDIHSHNDSDKFELGYDLSARNYINLFKNKKTRYKTTLDSLEKDKYEMLFGEGSIKATLERFWYKTLMPTGNEVYFNGGRNIEVYSGNNVGGIQIETPIYLLKEDLDKISKVLYNAINRFRDYFIKD